MKAHVVYEIGRLTMDVENKKKGEKEAHADNNDEELFSVEKIVDSKIDKNGVQLYKCRWKGYTAAHDTWEPTENVSSTGVSVLIIYCVILHNVSG